MKLYFQYSLHGFSNVYVIGPDHPGDAIIVDPAAFDVNLLSFIEKQGYTIKAVLVTHNHEAHVKALGTLSRIYDIDIYSASAEICDLPVNRIVDREVVTVSGIPVECLSVPGHSADSMVFRIDKLVFTGDSLSAGLIGRTNSTYGRRQLILNLWQKVLSLPDDTIILPGHGPLTTVRAERLYNVGLTEPTRRPSGRYKLLEW